MTVIATTTFTTSLSFNGADPYASLIANAAADLFGRTVTGSANDDGAVFELTNTGFAQSVVMLLNLSTATNSLVATLASPSPAQALTR